MVGREVEGYNTKGPGGHRGLEGVRIVCAEATNGAWWSFGDAYLLPVPIRLRHLGPQI